MSLIYIAAKPTEGPLAELVSLIPLWNDGTGDLYVEPGNRLEVRRDGRRVEIHRITRPRTGGVVCGSHDCHCTQDEKELMVEFDLGADGLQIDLGDPMPRIRLRTFRDEKSAQAWLDAS